MEDRRDNRVLDKVDSILKQMGEINVSLAEIKVDVAHHIKRTEILEQQIVPMREHTSELKGVIKFLKLAGIVIGIIEASRAFHVL